MEIRRRYFLADTQLGVCAQDLEVCHVTHSFSYSLHFSESSDLGEALVITSLIIARREIEAREKSELSKVI